VQSVERGHHAHVHLNGLQGPSTQDGPVE
jgi:hypothetical protein